MLSAGSHRVHVTRIGYIPDSAAIVEDQPYDTVVEVVTQAARVDTDPEDWPLVSVLFERALGAAS